MNMTNDNEKSLFEKNIQRGIEKQYISFSEDKGKITYCASRDYTTSFKNPEEKVRASYFAELVLDYKYPTERIDFEVTVPRRTPEDRADIVVYEDDELKNPYLIVECKKDGITDAEFKQAIEQVFGNANSLRANFASVIAGTTRTAFNLADFKPSERERNVIADIPKKYGKTPKYRFIKSNSVNDIKSISKEELIRTLKKSHDTVWQGGRLAPTTAFDEVSKLLFCKLKDEKDTHRNEPYKFQIGTHETSEDVFKRINEIYQKAKQQDAEVFKDDIRLEHEIVYSIIEHLQGIAFAKTDLDTKGVAFETFMTDFFKGKMGQFFTPREIIRFAVEMLNPTKDDLVLDPAAGSGGFLLNSMDNVREFAEKKYDEKEARDHWHSFAQHKLFGIEINDQIARICKMNMIIHDDGHTNVISTDALQTFKGIYEIHRKFKKDHFNIVLTNPPFGATVKRTEKDYLDKYELGKNKKTQKTEILFIEKVIDFVKPGTGMIGIVLPDGILTNSSLQYVRDLIMERCQILAVVSLPQFAFSHYGAGIKASLVFLRRKAENEELENHPIFMAIAEHIGYDATGRKDAENDLDKIFEEHKKFLDNPDNYEGFTGIFKMECFKIYRNEINGRIDPHFYRPSFVGFYNIFQKSNFEVNTIGVISEKVTSGATPKSKGNAYTTKEEGIPFIRSGDINEDKTINFDDVIYIKSEIHNNLLKGSKLKKGDILIAIVGATIGQVSIYDYEKEANINQAIALVRLKEGINPEYVKAFLLSKLGQKQLNRIKRPVARANINLDEIRGINIILPPMDIQTEIVESIAHSYQRHKELQKEAKNVLKEAKEKVERTILGEEEV